MAGEKETKWEALFKDIKVRLQDAGSRPDFLLYFLAIIVVTDFATFGITWYIENKLTHELCCHPFSHIHVILSIGAFFIALLTASSADLILSSKEIKDESLRSTFMIIGLGSIIIGYCIMVCAMLLEPYPVIGYILVTLGTFLAWFVWWIANYNNQNLSGGENTAPLGGEVTPPSDGQSQTTAFKLTGDTATFKN